MATSFGFDHSTSHFPFVYSAPPAFPDAGTYPYPPPASVYTPASGFFPEWPNRPPPAPDPPPFAPPAFPYASTYPYPPPAAAYPPTASGFSSFPAPAYASTPYAFPSPIPTQIDTNQPQAAATPIHGDSHLFPVLHHPTHLPCSQVQPPLAGTPATPQPNAAPTSPNRQYRPPQCHAATHAGSSASPLLELPNLAPLHELPDTDGPVLTEMEFVLPEPRGASALSPRSSPGTTAATTLTTPWPVHAPRTRSSSLGIAGTTYVAPHVFGEMPTPISWHGTQATTPNYCYEHQSPIQSSCVQGGSTNLSEQNLHGMPQSYGFSDLSRQSIILADGTKRSYYTLPADYPAKQASDGIFSFTNEKKSDTELLAVCSNNASDNADRSIKLKEMHLSDISEEEKHDNDQLLKCFSKAAETGQTSATTPDQQSYEEPQQDIEQLLKCVGKAPETDQRIACLNYSSRLFDYTLEQQQNDENASVNVQQLRDPQLNMLVTHEKREVWDPGASKFPVLFMTAAGAAKLQGTDVYKSEFTSSYEIQKFTVASKFPVSLIDEKKPDNELIAVCVNKASNNSFSEDATDFTSTHVPYLSVEEPIECHMTSSDTKLHSLPDSELGNTIRTAQVATQLWNKLLHEAGQQAWDPGIGISSSMYHWLQSLTAANARPLSSLQTPEQATWLSQLTIASYVWDLGNVLLLSKSIWLLPVTEEKEMVTLTPEQCSFLFNAMHSCQLFQRCTAMSSPLYWQQDIKFIGIALWLITFNPP